MPIILERLRLLGDYLEILHGLEDKISSVDDFVRDPILRGAVERYLHLAVEALIDVGFRICSLLGLEKPERYRELAGILRRANILSQESAEILELWIGFRNIMVHAYARIEPSKVVEALRSIGELEHIASEIRHSVVEGKIDPPELDSVACIVRDVLKTYPYVVFAYIFGSYAVGRAGDRSDVDVAVYVEGCGFGWREHVGLMHRLEDAVGRRVDLVVLNDAPLLLAYEVVSKGMLVYSRDDELRAEFESRVLREYLDVRLRLERV